MLSLQQIISYLKIIYKLLSFNLIYSEVRLLKNRRKENILKNLKFTKNYLNRSRKFQCLSSLETSPKRLNKIKSLLTKTVELENNTDFTPFLCRAKNLMFEDFEKQLFKWKNLLELLKLIFFYNLKFNIFGNKFFQEELSFLNWELADTTFHMFKKNQMNFFLSDWHYGSKSLNIFKKLINSQVSGILVLDVNYHKRTLYYARIIGLFSIVLSVSNSNNWLFSHQYQIFLNSFFMQKYFLRILFLLKKESSKSIFA